MRRGQINNIALRYSECKLEIGPMVEKTSGARRQPSQADYETLSEFRYRIRCFLEFSQEAARAVGLTPRQHQALLAIKGFKGGGPASVGDLAERLRIRHHSAAELVDRLAEAGLVERGPGAGDQRRVLLHLTAQAEARLAELSAAHLEELSKIGPILDDIRGLT
jgi:DNA-binding MarR family transcriptional regulator